VAPQEIAGHNANSWNIEAGARQSNSKSALLDLDDNLMVQLNRLTT